MINIDLEKRRNKAFFMVRCKYTGEIEKNAPKRKKFTSKALVVALKKKTHYFLPFFKALSPFSRLLPDLENCWANFETFSRIQDSVRTLSKKFLSIFTAK